MSCLFYHTQHLQKMPESRASGVCLILLTDKQTDQCSPLGWGKYTLWYFSFIGAQRERALCWAWRLRPRSNKRMSNHIWSQTYFRLAVKSSLYVCCILWWCQAACVLAVSTMPISKPQFPRFYSHGEKILSSVAVVDHWSSQSPQSW